MLQLSLVKSVSPLKRIDLSNQLWTATLTDYDIFEKSQVAERFIGSLAPLSIILKTRLV
jgi:hypothetical protein